MEWPLKLQIAGGIIQGALYLHSKGIVHGDLKLQNILLSAGFIPKVSFVDERLSIMWMFLAVINYTLSK